MNSNTTNRRKPPIRCTPCRVQIGTLTYHIHSNGDVYIVKPITGADGERVQDVDDAKDIRRYAARLRRNRNARERHQAMRDLGMKQTPYGWE